MRARRRRARARPLKTAFGILCLLLLGWAGGLAFFLWHLPVPEPPPVSDGIVVLTGGSARIRAGFALLQKHKGRRLFISGVHPGLSKESLGQLVPGQQKLLACCVDLGFAAADTFGNAVETAAWAQEHHYRSLIIVTADYHMPRALVELDRHLPGVALHPYAVVPAPLKTRSPAGWWQDRSVAGLLIGEYDKYLLALVLVRLDKASGGRLERWLSDRETKS